MPRFFFNSEDGDYYRDQRGILLPDLVSAQREGVKVFGELILHDPELFLRTATFKVIIQDEHHATVYVLAMSCTVAEPERAAPPTLAGS